ncbi:MAG TPA: UDP-N-acetylmuramoyl-L-alanine--D-glutamate ligase [Acidocella sp.]|nr:UDP-N-acetylmuramoyl-L-alanine--D-glutamate ligase [Acidocella sp.]
MNYAQVFHNQRFAVVGLGKAGLPAARALKALGAEVYVWDDFAPSRDAAEGFTVMRPHDIGKPLDALVLSPGIPHKLPTPHPEAAWALANHIAILTDAELLYRAVRGSGSKAKFVGITGTNGKSTTTVLLAHILDIAKISNAAGANLGPAALSLPLLPDDGVYVLEMSSYMLERLVETRFDVAIMLNLSPDHLDRHGDMAGYALAKREIFSRQSADCTAIVGMDDPESRAMASWLHTQPAKVVEISAKTYIVREARALPGAHNAQNAAAATAAARALGVAETAIAEGIRSYPGLPHRQAQIADIHGIRFINDSKATNADAASRAMDCYDHFIWIAGGIAKAGGIESLAPLFPRIRKAFLIGKDAASFAQALNKHNIPNDIVGTLDDAVPLAHQAARATGTEIVLLSPAAASFDQFSSFEQRGDYFTSLAKAIV